MSGSDGLAGASGHALSVERVIDAGAEAAGGQRIRLAQRGFPAVSARDEYTNAWADVLGELATRITAKEEQSR
jgi:hypothetical protein